MKIQDSTNKKALTSRLRRVEGQLRGIVDMIERGEDCADIATQLSACRSGIQHTLGSFAACAIEEAQDKMRGSKRRQDDIKKLLKLIA